MLCFFTQKMKYYPNDKRCMEFDALNIFEIENYDIHSIAYTKGHAISWVNTNKSSTLSSQIEVSNPIAKNPKQLSF